MSLPCIHSLSSSPYKVHLLGRAEKAFHNLPPASCPLCTPSGIPFLALILSSRFTFCWLYPLPVDPFSKLLSFAPVLPFLNILLTYNILLEVCTMLAFPVEIGIPSVSLCLLNIQTLTLSSTITTLGGKSHFMFFSHVQP